MKTRGFALLTVLWVLVAIGATAATGMAAARRGVLLASNRVVLRRAAWAREGCVEMLLARLNRAARLPPFVMPPAGDTVDLGQRIWCRAVLDAPSDRLNLNLAPAADLLRLLGSERLIASVLAHRPLPAVEAITQLSGWSPAMRSVLPLLVTVGDGRIDLNRAPREVLLALPGATASVVDRVLWERAMGRRIHSPEEFPALLSEQQVRTFGPSYQGFLHAAVTTPPLVLATVEGGLRGLPLVAGVQVSFVVTDRGAAIVRRETR